MRKSANCLCQNKSADQLPSDRTADMAFVFAILIEQPLYFLNLKYQVSYHFLWLYSLAAWFVSDLVENTEDRFCRVKAHIIIFSPERADPDQTNPREHLISVYTVCHFSLQNCMLHLFFRP